VVFFFFWFFQGSTEQGGGWDTTAINIAELKNENCQSAPNLWRLFNIISYYGAERRQPFCLGFRRTIINIMLRQGGRVTAPLGVIAAKENKKRGHERSASPQVGMDEGTEQNGVGGGYGLRSLPIIFRHTCRMRHKRAYKGGNDNFYYIVLFFSKLNQIAKLYLYLILLKFQSKCLTIFFFLSI